MATALSNRVGVTRPDFAKGVAVEATHFGGTPLTRDGAEALAAELVAEMTRRWRAGERPLAEEFLDRHPALRDHAEAAADLIYEEICLREEFAAEASVKDVLNRFPQWRPQLELLVDCQRLLGPRRPVPRFPSAGESLDDFLLLAELGRGIHGRVFLASQLSLGDRPVVLKLTPCDASEHLSLARLQHTHIVPLYSVQDNAARGLRALCMPYFGGATLAGLLDALRSTPPGDRSGRDLLSALDRLSAADSIINSEHDTQRSRVPASRPISAGATYAQTVCCIGVCLADAMQYAHDRGLVHLDLKPSNVLLTADGQPMVLDFHLAREPISPDDSGPAWLGGTPAYMSPEQTEALWAVQQGRPVSRQVDGRSDLFSLGVVMYEALAGNLPWLPEQVEEMTTIRADAGRGFRQVSQPSAPQKKLRRLAPLALYHRNPQVSVGLSDIIQKCLAADPSDRYQSMSALSADLRRHLAEFPLAGVRNRSLSERWHKWRRRRPHGIALAGMMGAVVAATCAIALGLVNHVSDRIHQARAALAEGRVQADNGQWDLAAATLRRGLVAIENLPWQGDLAGDLRRSVARTEEGQLAANRAALAADLHRLADRARFLYGAERVPPSEQAELAAACSEFWANRERIVERLRLNDQSSRMSTVRADLIDLAICCANADGHPITVLDQAEALLGPSPVLEAERHLNGPWNSTRPAPAAQTAWEHYAVGRALLRAGDLDRAAAEVDEAVRLEPQGLWSNYYQGVCAYRRGQFMDAVAAFGVCIGAAPDAAGCYVNRALAFAALGRKQQAMRDYDLALRLDPALTNPLLDELRQPLARPTSAPISASLPPN